MKFSNEELFLKKLSDDELLFDTREAVKNEREATSLVVKYFREIEARQLYFKHDCTSLFDFATSKLGYCEGSAQNRINAMKLVIALPELEEKLETGELSLTAASKVHSFFRAERKAKKSYTTEEQLEVVELCLSKSTRAVDRELAGRNPEFAKYESIKPVGKDRFELKFTITQEVEAKIRKLKGLRAHAQPSMTTEALLETLIELGLEKFDPARRAERSLKRKGVQHNGSDVAVELIRKDSLHAPETPDAITIPNVTQTRAENPKPRTHEALSKTSYSQHSAKRTRYIPANVRNQVWARNANQGCELKLDSGARCGSHQALQIDHVKGFAIGGEHSLENLRVLCSKHNRFVWSSQFSNSRGENSWVQESVVGYECVS